MRVLISKTGPCVVTGSSARQPSLYSTDGRVYTANSNHQFLENNTPTSHKENYNLVWMDGNNVMHMIEQNNDTYNYYVLNMYWE